MRTRIKICGITRLEDALCAAELGADALGFVFYAKSPRYIEPAAAREIVAALPPFVTTVGLFLDARGETIRETLAEVALDMLQFHGDECPADCGAYDRPYLKAVPMGGAIDVAGYMNTYPDAAGFLLDSHAPGMAGGTGETFDWRVIPPKLPRPVILAGGLSADNVAQALHQNRVWGVDVSSGVEQSPGIKDAAKMAAFIDEVKSVDSE